MEDNQTSIQNQPEVPTQQMPAQKKISLGRAVTFIILILVVAAAVYIFTAKINTGTATISWDTNSEPDLAGYKVYYGTSPRTADCPPDNYPKNIDVGKTATPNSPTYTLKNLIDDQPYYFSITSYDTSGNESCFSAELSKKMPEPEVRAQILNSFQKFWEK